MHTASGTIAPQVTAAWITAILALTAGIANIVVTLRTRASDQRERAKERAEDLEVRRVERTEDVASGRRERAEAQQRETYASFVQAAEELVDRLQRHITLGRIASHIADLELRQELVEEAAAKGCRIGGEDLPPMRENPLPVLPQPEADLLTALSIRARTARVMVEIVGPRDVGIAAIAYERDLDLTTRNLIDRDVSAGRSFIASAGSRTGFVDAARAALDPEI
ncbi:MAG: hypothetical protein QOG46_932 [Pseudonocardiales bacterium]|jgi:predicted nucleic acid-binding protein|nr:hypothetical protein [Pseudonocardiales bacterium]